MSIPNAFRSVGKSQSASERKEASATRPSSSDSSSGTRVIVSFLLHTTSWQEDDEANLSAAIARKPQLSVILQTTQTIMQLASAAKARVKRREHEHEYRVRWFHALMQRRLGQREMGGRLHLHADTRKRPEENAENDMSVAASMKSAGAVPNPCCP